MVEAAFSVLKFLIPWKDRNASDIKVYSRLPRKTQAFAEWE